MFSLYFTIKVNIGFVLVCFHDFKAGIFYICEVSSAEVNILCNNKYCESMKILFCYLAPIPLVVSTVFFGGGCYDLL